MKSDNTKGNPYHDEEGKFTSGEGVGSKKTKAIKIKKDFFAESEKPSGIKIKKGSLLDNAILKLNDLNQVSNIPKLNTANEIESNIENYFSKKVCDKLNEMYGASSGCSKWQFHPKSNPNVSLNLFTCVLGKYRYKDNHAHILTPTEFDALMPQEVFNNYKKTFFNTSYAARSKTVLPLQPIFRGITSSGDKRKNIIDSYGTLDLNNYDIYGNGMFGTNIYTTVDISYANSYGTPIYGILDTKNAHYMNENEIRNVQNDLKQNLDNHRQKIEQKMIENGIDTDKATHIAGSFIKSVQSDMSLVSVLLGLDFQVCDNHQRNILNLNRWYIKGEAQHNFKL